jgi:hypothetical protein
MTPGCPHSTWSCCCSSFNSSAYGYGTLTCFTGHATLSLTCCFRLSLSIAPAVSTSEFSAMKSQLAFTPEALTCCTLYNHCAYFLTLLVIYECWNILKNNTALMALYSYYLHPSEPGSSLGFFLGSCLSREFFLATVLLHLHCLLFGEFRLGFCIAHCDIC